MSGSPRFGNICIGKKVSTATIIPLPQQAHSFGCRPYIISKSAIQVLPFV